MVEEGGPAPGFACMADDGAEVSLDSLRGRFVVLYFYPRDDTPGCTREALDFTSAAGDFAQAGAVVLGCSRDSVDSHRRFRERHRLAVTLLDDTGGTLCELFGTWVEKNRYGRKYMGVQRATFLIGPDGIIRKIWRNVRVPGHVDEVLGVLRAAGNGP